ncbi:unnamed protein product [Nezara viridula]|uniref:Neuropeptide n=1 Tax=Nezara viridula TaxID=85310 RepID=A0A9P0HRF9_NEZVI|nr:unnamed protein product [Nezara viridula]
MKLVLFLCLLGVCLVAAEEGVIDKYNPYCNTVDCNDCYFRLNDCYDCCRDVPIDCYRINCYECDIKFCGHCCD